MGTLMGHVGPSLMLAYWAITLWLQTVVSSKWRIRVVTFFYTFGPTLLVVEALAELMFPKCFDESGAIRMFCDMHVALDSFLVMCPIAVFLWKRGVLNRFFASIIQAGIFFCVGFMFIDHGSHQDAVEGKAHELFGMLWYGASLSYIFVAVEEYYHELILGESDEEWVPKGLSLVAIFMALIAIWFLDIGLLIYFYENTKDVVMPFVHMLTTFFFCSVLFVVATHCLCKNSNRPEREKYSSVGNNEMQTDVEMANLGDDLRR
jgi:hypothetical protein